MPLALEFADVDTGAEYFRHFFNQVFFAATNGESYHSSAAFLKAISTLLLTFLEPELVGIR